MSVIWFKALWWLFKACKLKILTSFNHIAIIPNFYSHIISCPVLSCKLCFISFVSQVKRWYEYRRYVWCWMSLLRPGVVKQHKNSSKLSFVKCTPQLVKSNPNRILSLDYSFNHFFRHYHTIMFQLVVVDKNGHHLDRLSPWAQYVVQIGKAVTFDQRFWNPPKEQVCTLADIKST